MKQKIADKEQLLANDDPVDMQAWYDSKNKELEEKRTKIEELKGKLGLQKEELDQAQEKHDGLLGKKIALDRKTQALNQKLSKLQEDQIEERYDALLANTEVLDHIRTRILNASKSIGVSDSDIPAVLKNDLTEVSNTLMKLRSAITDYTSQLEKTISGK